jgi:hypothetical protein
MVSCVPDYAEVIWNDSYRVSSDLNDNVCEYPLARNLVVLRVAVACEAIIAFVATGEQRPLHNYLEGFECSISRSVAFSIYGVRRRIFYRS